MVDNISRALTLYRQTSSLLVCGVLSADKTLLITMRCFSHMLITNVHKSIIVMNSIDTRFSRNVFKAVQKTRSTCFVRSKTTAIKHSCSFFKHYITEHKICNVSLFITTLHVNYYIFKLSTEANVAVQSVQYISYSILYDC